MEQAAMNDAGRATYEVTEEDAEYLRHGDRSLLLRLFRPKGKGPFPLVVQLHGGAWCKFDRLSDTPINAPLAAQGFMIAALDFRMPPEAPYPASMADINYGVRWLKTNAARLAIDPRRIGIMGSSSGGHQAMLTGMRPHDPRYAAHPQPVGGAATDASVQCVVLCSPVIDPLGRYHYAKKLKEGGPPYPQSCDLWLPCHDEYWVTEEAMAEGSPVRALERREKVALPPVLYIHGTHDMAHPWADLQRFVKEYRKAGGHLEFELFDGQPEGFMTRDPGGGAAAAARDKVAVFLRRHLA